MATDPDLTRIESVVIPTETGDTLTVPLEYVDKSPITVNWAQTFMSKSDTYYQLVYTNTTRNNSKYFLFVSSGKLEQFRKLDTGNGVNGKITFKVTGDFFYGEKDKRGMNRFLVLHDKDRNIFQHRFIQASFMQNRTMLAGFFDNINGDSDARKALELLTKIAGHALVRFT